MKRYPDLREVRLYFPNSWRKHATDLVPTSYKRFNWFLCSQRYKDPNSELYVAEISKSATFYDEHSGHTLVVSKKDGETKLLIVDDPENKRLHNLDAEDIIEIIIKYNYQGIAKLERCDIKNADQFFVCREASFGFIDGALEISKKEERCAIIDYAKKNNKCIRAVLLNFPTVEEIDDALKRHECSSVCKVIYQDIMNYMNK